MERDRKLLLGTVLRTAGIVCLSSSLYVSEGRSLSRRSRKEHKVVQQWTSQFRHVSSNSTVHARSVTRSHDFYLESQTRHRSHDIQTMILKILLHTDRIGEKLLVPSWNVRKRVDTLTPCRDQKRCLIENNLYPPGQKLGYAHCFPKRFNKEQNLVSNIDRFLSISIH